MTENWGIKYALVALGNPEERATSEDLATAVAVIAERTGFVVTPVEGFDADRISVMFLGRGLRVRS